MNSSMIQLLVLAGIAVFLVLKLRSVLGTREGFEKPREPVSPVEPKAHDFEVIDGGDPDITDHVDENSKSAKSLAKMKELEPSFGLGDFLHGAKGAYEMILMAFERGQLDTVAPFLSSDVYEAFAQVVDQREDQGLTIEAEFVGVRETSLENAHYDGRSKKAQLTVHFVGEMISVVKDNKGKVIEGKAGQSKRQSDTWTFERAMGSDDPNWRLVATGE